MIVLIVEDNALLAFMMEDALNDSGFTILGPVSRADAALRLVEETRPNLAPVYIDLDGERPASPWPASCATAGTPQRCSRRGRLVRPMVIPTLP